MISNYPLLLFGEKLDYDPEHKIIKVDDFVKIQTDQKIANVIQVGARPPPFLFGRVCSWGLSCIIPRS